MRCCFDNGDAVCFKIRSCRLSLGRLIWVDMGRMWKNGMSDDKQVWRVGYGAIERGEVNGVEIEWLRALNRELE